MGATSGAQDTPEPVANPSTSAPQTMKLVICVHPTSPMLSALTASCQTL